MDYTIASEGMSITMGTTMGLVSGFSVIGITSIVMQSIVRRGRFIHGERTGMMRRVIGIIMKNMKG